MDILIKVTAEGVYNLLMNLPLKEKVALVAKLIIIPSFCKYGIYGAYHNLKQGRDIILVCIIGSGFMFGYLILNYYFAKMP